MKSQKNRIELVTRPDLQFQGGRSPAFGLKPAASGDSCRHLPPTLRLFVMLWEEIRSYCIHAIMQQFCLLRCLGAPGVQHAVTPTTEGGGGLVEAPGSNHGKGSAGGEASSEISSSIVFASEDAQGGGGGGGGGGGRAADKIRRREARAWKRVKRNAAAAAAALHPAGMATETFMPSVFFVYYPKAPPLAFFATLRVPSLTLTLRFTFPEVLRDQFYCFA